MVIRIFTSSGVAFFKIWFHCRKNELHAADAAHLLLFLIGVVHARFLFRPNTPLGKTPIAGVLPRGRSQPDGLQRQTRPILQTRTQFGALPLRSFVHPFRVRRKDPGVSSFLAGLAHDLGVVGRIAQHDDFGARRQRQACESCRRPTSAVVRCSMPSSWHSTPWCSAESAIGMRDARRRDQQAEREAVALLVNDLLLVVATALCRAAAAVAGAVGVFRLLAGLADQRRIDQKKKLAPAALQPQQSHSQGLVEVVLSASGDAPGTASVRRDGSISEATLPAACEQLIRPRCMINASTIRRTSILRASSLQRCFCHEPLERGRRFRRR